MSRIDFQKSAKDFSERIYKHFDGNSGRMLLETGLIGIGLSTLAQAGAICLNDKYTISQKAFMVPQELTEGVVSMLSLAAITIPLQIFARNYAKSGKILTKDLKDYMVKYDLMKNRGKLGFDLAESINGIKSSVQKSDVFIKASEQGKEELLKEHENTLQLYNAVKDSTSAIVTTIGGIISTALILPFLRNQSASYYQKVNMQAYNRVQERKKNDPYYNNSRLFLRHSDPLKV